MNFFKYTDLARAMRPHDHDLRCFHASFLVRQGKILSIGMNSAKTHPINLGLPYFGRDNKDFRLNCGTHSEVRCLLKKVFFNKAIMVNVRIDRNGEIANSRPCKGCQSFLARFNIPEVYFSVAENEWGILTF